MTLLTVVFAAIISTVVWYCNHRREKLKLGCLVLMYWGASLMWLVDAFFEYAELQTAYFTPTAGNMLNDFFLGISVVALGLVIWLFRLLISDPMHVL